MITFSERLPQSRIILFGCSRGGWAVGPIWCYSALFLYLLCISCPIDIQCPIKAVTINQTIKQLINKPFRLFIIRLWSIFLWVSPAVPGCWPHPLCQGAGCWPHLLCQGAGLTRCARVLAAVWVSPFMTVSLVEYPTQPHFSPWRRFALKDL